jgi:hypothetical protein
VADESGGERHICAKLGNSGRATHLCQGGRGHEGQGGQGGRGAGARRGRLRGRTSHDLSRLLSSFQGRTAGSRFLISLHKIITSQNNKKVVIFDGEAQQYDLLVYQRKTLLFPRSARIDGIRVYAPHADEKSAKSKRARPLREVREVQKSPPVAAARWRRDQLTAQSQPHGRAR